MKKMIMLAAVITVGFSITAGLSYAAHAEAKQAAALAYYNNAVYKEAVAGEEYAIQIADNSDAADAEAVIARSNLADAAVETVMLDEESEAAVKVKEMASVCDDDIEAAVAKYKKEHTPAATSTVSSAAPSIESITAECAARPGMYGRLRIPTVGVNVAVISGDSAEIVDAEDSADFYPNYCGMTIGDHANQGFIGISRCVPGSTLAYIDTPSGTQTFICTGVQRGINDGWYFWNPDGTQFAYDGLFMCTCAGADWHQVWLVTWAPA